MWSRVVWSIKWCKMEILRYTHPRIMSVEEFLQQRFVEGVTDPVSMKGNFNLHILTRWQSHGHGWFVTDHSADWIVNLWCGAETQTDQSARPPTCIKVAVNKRWWEDEVESSRCCEFMNFAASRFNVKISLPNTGLKKCRLTAVWMMFTDYTHSVVVPHGTRAVGLWLGGCWVHKAQDFDTNDRDFHCGGVEP